MALTEHMELQALPEVLVDAEHAADGVDVEDEVDTVVEVDMVVWVDTLVEVAEVVGKEQVFQCLSRIQSNSHLYRHRYSNTALYLEECDGGNHRNACHLWLFYIQNFQLKLIFRKPVHDELDILHCVLLLPIFVFHSDYAQQRILEDGH